MTVVLSSLALKGVLERLRPPCELRFGATQALLKAISEGERADLLILTTEAMEDLRKKGQVTQVHALGSSGVGIAVMTGAPRPAIGSVEELVRSLLAARSVAHSKVGASGMHFAGILKKLGIADSLKKRIVVEKGPVALLVAAGEAEIGVQLLCELVPVPGIDIVGPLPEPLQMLSHFAAGIAAEAADPKGAAALIELLCSDAARKAMVESGMQPAAR